MLRTAASLLQFQAVKHPNHKDTADPLLPFVSTSNLSARDTGTSSEEPRGSSHGNAAGGKPAGQPLMDMLVQTVLWLGLAVERVRSAPPGGSASQAAHAGTRCDTQSAVHCAPESSLRGTSDALTGLARGLRRALESAIHLLTNITNGSPEGCRQVAQARGLEAFATMLMTFTAGSQRPQPDAGATAGPGFESGSGIRAERGGSAGQGAAQLGLRTDRLDEASALMVLLTNMVEHERGHCDALLHTALKAREKEALGQDGPHTGAGVGPSLEARMGGSNTVIQQGTHGTRDALGQEEALPAWLSGGNMRVGEGSAEGCSGPGQMACDGGSFEAPGGGREANGWQRGAPQDVVELLAWLMVEAGRMAERGGRQEGGGIEGESPSQEVTVEDMDREDLAGHASIVAVGA